MPKGDGLFKVCRTCGQRKHISHFGSQRPGLRKGTCRECWKAKATRGYAVGLFSTLTVEATEQSKTT